MNVILNLGFVKLKRNITSWRWFHNHKTFKLYIFLLCNANIADKEFEDRTIKKGQVLTSLESLSKNTNLSIQEVRTALKNLKLTNDITVKATSKYTLITVNEDNAFNLDTNLATNSQQSNNNQITNIQQQYKKDKNDKNDKNDNKDNNDKSYTHTETQKVIDMFNLYCTNLDSANIITSQELNNVKLILSKYSLDEIKECFINVNKSNFLTGLSTDFKAFFGWVVNPSNFAKIKSGKYNDFSKPLPTSNDINNANLKSPSFDMDEYEQMLKSVPDLF